MKGKVAKSRNGKDVLVATSYGEHRCLFERDEDGSWIVTAPALPGVVTWGKSLIEAKKMAREAIECYIEGVAKLTFQDEVKKRAKLRSHSLA